MVWLHRIDCLLVFAVQHKRFAQSLECVQITRISLNFNFAARDKSGILAPFE
jgi:hypothetical protein